MSDALPHLPGLEVVMRRHILNALPVDRSATMRDLNFRSLLHVFAAWRSRVPPKGPRRVHVSAELLANPERAPFGDGLASVIREIALGDDLRPRMSLGIEHAYAPDVPPLLARRQGGRHLDALLDDWGIHHLHVYVEPHRSRPGFTRRSPYVLLVAFQPHDAYLIDLAGHESDGANWSALSILETVVRNWPKAGVVLPVGALGLVGGNSSDEDRRLLRTFGVRGPVEIDGGVWMPGIGLGGTWESVSRHAMDTTWFLSGHQPTEEDVRAGLSEMAAKHGVPDTWQGHVDGDDFGFFGGGVFVRYGSLLPSLSTAPVV
jgi:hypothetical protein